ncbi:winged helix DNA-binding protein [Salinispirillum marinum]|uniref:Winged helix DNA-binding protein n=2 Tax=Saccharospirillaceae TaxID=255527 RepID=A0ABV8BGD3_9GAMM
MPDQLLPPVPIVSSSHLVSEKGASLSEYEFGLIIANNSFNRWMMHCAKSSGAYDMAPLDVLVVHNINHRERAKRIADICFVLNVEDTHTITYSVKKLAKQNLVKGVKQGKEIFYSTTEEGEKFCLRYKENRERCLVSSLKQLGFAPAELSEIASTLRALSGLYDQASRSAASL